MEYHTEAEILKHVWNNLFPSILGKYELTDEEKGILMDAKRICLKLATKIDKKEE